jgi:RNA recognition motif-containing protein
MNMSSAMLRGVPYSVDENTLAQALQGSGIAFRGLKVVRDRNTGLSRGFAFVDFDSSEEASRFVEHSSGRFAVGGVDVSVDFSKRNHDAQDWMCFRCGKHNFAKRDVCFSCHSPKDEHSTPVSRDVFKRNHEMGNHPASVISPFLESLDSYNYASCAGGTNSLVVSNLDGYTDQDTIRYSLAPYAPVKNVRIVYDSTTGLSRGYAYVDFSNHEDTVVVMNACGQGLQIDGKDVQLEWSANFVPPETCQNTQTQFQEYQQIQQVVPQLSGPPGYTYDPNTGYFYEPNSGYYYIPSTQLYYHSASQKYFKYDLALNEYLEVTHSGAPIESVPAPIEEPMPTSVDMPSAIVTTEMKQIAEESPSGIRSTLLEPKSKDSPEEVSRITIQEKKIRGDLLRWNEKKVTSNVDLDHSSSSDSEQEEDTSMLEPCLRGPVFLCLLCRSRFLDFQHLNRHEISSSNHNKLLLLSPDQKEKKIRESIDLIGLNPSVVTKKVSRVKISSSRRPAKRFNICRISMILLSLDPEFPSRVLESLWFLLCLPSPLFQGSVQSC